MLGTPATGQTVGAAALRAEGSPPPRAETRPAAERSVLEATTIEYDWNRRSPLSMIPARSDRPLRIHLTGLNPICYSYTYKFNRHQAEQPSAGALLALLGVTEAATGKKGTQSPSPAPQSGVDSGEEEEPEARPAPSPSPGTAGTRRPASEQASEREQVVGDTVAANTVDFHTFASAIEASSSQSLALPEKARLVSEQVLNVLSSIDRAEGELEEVEQRIALAAVSAGQAKDLACVGNAPVQEVLARWRNDYSRDSNSLDTGRKQIDDARRAAEGARERLLTAALTESDLQGSPAYDRHRDDPTKPAGRLRAGLDGANERLRLLERRILEVDRRRAETASAVERANMAMASIEQYSTFDILVPTGDLTDRVDIVIQATRAVKGESGAKTEEYPWTVDVRRMRRFFLSGGFVLSSLREHDYARVNVPCPAKGSGGPASCEAGTDSTYSTYGDRAGDRGFAYAPMVIANAVLGEPGGLPLAVSAGVAARSVSGNNGIDYLLGLSTTFLDHAVITLGAYHARTEKLLLDRDPEAVRKRAIPASITEAEAVGTRRVWDLALSISFRQ
jgi:hypothetical protein